MVLDIASVGLLLTLVSCVVGFLAYNLAKKKEDKQEIMKDATEQTTLKNEITFIKEELSKLKNDPNAQTRQEMQLNYISRGVDDIRLDLKAQDNKINNLSEKVARLEESTKSAHKRLDEGGM